MTVFPANIGMGVYAAKVPLIMGKAAVLAYVAGPTLRSMRVARWPGNTAAGPRCQGEPWNKCPGRWITSNEVSANAILKRVTKHYTVVIKPQTAT